MVCIYCHAKTTVANSRSSTKTPATWRRRSCEHCHATFTTREYADLAQSLRIKTTSDSLEAFLRDKLFLSIYRSVSHRKTALTDASELTDTVIGQLLGQKTAIIPIPTLFKTTHSTLQRFDSAAATYYHAHHGIRR